MTDHHSEPLVLVTGAAGKTGLAVITALLADGLAVRALVRDSVQAQRVAKLGVEQVVAGDLRVDSALDEAVRGVGAIYHICPNLHPEEAAIGRCVIHAARQHGVGRFVFHSVLHPQTEAMPHHWAKLRVEEGLFTSGLAFTILQPAPYMQNILAQWSDITSERVYRVPYAPSTRLALVDLEDVAAVVPRILREPLHAGATYELCGTRGLDQTEIAAVLSEALGNAIRVEKVPRDAWSRAAHCAPGSYRYDALARMFDYYERYGIAGGAATLEWLLGRPPTGLSNFVARHASR